MASLHMNIHVHILIQVHPPYTHIYIHTQNSFLSYHPLSYNAREWVALAEYAPRNETP